MKKFAVVFDLNGTIVDTEIAHSSAYTEVLKKYRVTFTITEFTEYWSRHGKKIDDYLKDIGREDLLKIEKQIKEEKDEIFRRTLESTARLMPGTLELLERLKGVCPLGLESSSPLANVMALLNHFGIARFFDAVVPLDAGFDEKKYGVAKNKSSRLKFAAEKLGYACSACVLVGAAEKDIRAAKEAGMKAIAIPNQYTESQNFTEADKIIPSLSEITPEILDSLF